MQSQSSHAPGPRIDNLTAPEIESLIERGRLLRAEAFRSGVIRGWGWLAASADHLAQSGARLAGLRDQVDRRGPQSGWVSTKR